MLNREKLSRELFSRVSQLFPDLRNEDDLARKIWNAISQDEAFSQRASAAQSSFLVPTWQTNLNDTFAVPEINNGYIVVAVDGSQIYPDRHVSGAGCFLINVGGITLSYGESSNAILFNEPKVLLPDDVRIAHEEHFSRDLVDLLREEYELLHSFKQALLLEDAVCLMDGTLIFWTLEGKSDAVKKFFLQRYLHHLDQFYQNKILVAGYISMPKSRELVNLIKLGLCRFTVADCIACHKEYDEFPCKQVDHVLDTHVARYFLHENQRTTVFYSTSNIVESYPDHLKQAFVYMHVGSEIVRIEMPRWIAENKTYLDHVCAVALDQSKKGNGYPVCLAEAHEQAVVKGADREFFYHLLCKISMDKRQRLRFSPKSIKKRGIGV